jgi:CheY-like chemotaxis protein
VARHLGPSQRHSLRVLLADSDRRLTELMLSTLEAAGHAVAISGNASSLERALARTAPELLVLDVDHGHGGGVRVATAWRSTAAGRRGVVLLVGGRDEKDPRVLETLKAVDGKAYLQKPFSLLDLNTMLDRLRPVGPAPAPAPPPAPPPPEARRLPDVAPRESGLRALTARAAQPESAASRLPRGAKQVARLWATCSTGFLVISSGGGRERRVRMASGGLVDRDGWAMLSGALTTGTVRFERGPVPGEGDAGALGRALLDMARGGAVADALAAHRFDRLVPSVSLEMLVSLPLHPRTMASLGVAEESVGAALSKAGELEETVAIELDALVQLGLVDLQARGSVPRRAPKQAQRARAKERAEGAPAEDLHTVARPGRGRAPAEATGTGGTRPDFRRGRGPATSNPSVSNPPSSGVRGRSGVRAALRRSPAVARRRAVSSLSSDIRAKANSPARLHRQLKGELERLVDAPPPVVLGIPSDSDADLVEQAAARLRLRYSRLAERPGLPTPVRVISRRLAELVDQSHRAMIVRARSARDDGMDTFADRPTDMALRPVMSEEERLLAMGEQLIDQGRWEQADKVLTRARDLCLGHAGILSGLAWARMHSPARAPGARVEEARDLLLLAEQFGGADDAKIQRRLAFAYLAESNLDKANIRGQRALRIAPDDPDNQALRRALDEALPPTT